MGKQRAKRAWERQERDDLLARDAEARTKGPDVKKRWAVTDIKEPKHQPTAKQRDAMRAYNAGSGLALIGSAGTGKTWLACYIALRDLLSEGTPTKRVIFVRSTVQGREQGHLPGTLEEKAAPFENPYRDKIADLTGRPTAYDNFKELGKIEFYSTSILRGESWDDAVVILDEVQNLTWPEIDSVVTRIGKNSRLIVAGDTKAQCDLGAREATGVHDFMRVISLMGGFHVEIFTQADIVRSAFVKAWICAVESIQSRKQNGAGVEHSLISRIVGVARRGIHALVSWVRPSALRTRRVPERGGRDLEVQRQPGEAHVQS